MRLRVRVHPAQSFWKKVDPRFLKKSSETESVGASPFPPSSPASKSPALGASASINLGAGAASASADELEKSMQALSLGGGSGGGGGSGSGSGSGGDEPVLGKQAVGRVVAILDASGSASFRYALT